MKSQKQQKTAFKYTIVDVTASKINYLKRKYCMCFTFISLKEHLNNIGSNGTTMINVNISKFENIRSYQLGQIYF